jgi:uncharacterized membrane protein YtjA (UPF0391 family)
MNSSCGILKAASSSHNHKEGIMLWYTIVFLIIAIVAAIFGFGGIATAATGIARVLFFVFLVLFIVSLIFGRRGTV